MARGAAELQFPSCPGCRARAIWAGTREPRWGTDPGGWWKCGTLVRRERQDKGGQDLALFWKPLLAVRSSTGLGMGGAPGACRFCPPPVTFAPTWSSRECQTSGGLGPAFASRGLGLARWSQGDAEARVASIPLLPCASRVSTRRGGGVGRIPSVVPSPHPVPTETRSPHSPVPPASATAFSFVLHSVGSIQW